MGQRPGDGAVVDATGRVHATGRLTVADASIVPNATSAFTHIPDPDARRAPRRTDRLSN